ncbi:MAG: single-stranded-DNA-specific exonuclease RecJ [Opitutales bacterium]
MSFRTTNGQHPVKQQNRRLDIYNSTLQTSIFGVPRTRWTYTPIPAERIDAISREFGVSSVLAELICRIELEDSNEIRLFLERRLKELEDPFRLTQLRQAVARIRAAMKKKEEVVVFGDYDVDGVTSMTLLVSILQRLGANPKYVVPRRMEEGYGLSRLALERLLATHNPKLLIAVDCGTTSIDEVAYLREREVDVIIIDHHRSKETLPVDCILINPHVQDEPGQPWTNLCTVGLVFKLVHGLIKELRAEGDSEACEIELKDYLDLVAMGTIADLVPLLDENRILAYHGLRSMKNSNRHGLHALLQVSGLKAGEDVRPVDIAFRIGPRINASGRIADAAVPVEMLLSNNPKFCFYSARKLDEYNRERQDIERKIVLEADQLIEATVENPSGIVLYGEQWHPGVVGIVASRLCRKYHRPSIVLGNEGVFAKGSGRSIKGLNLVHVLEECDDLLESWGGHPLAVGVALRKENVAEFQSRFAALVQKRIEEMTPVPEQVVSAWIDLEDVNEKLLTELDRLQPFGQGNPEPVFGVRSVLLYQRPHVFSEHHFRFQLRTPSRRIFGVAWKMAHFLPPVNTPIDFICRVYRNCYNGRRHLQVEMIDWRLSST